MKVKFTTSLLGAALIAAFSAQAASAATIVESNFPNGDFTPAPGAPIDSAGTDIGNLSTTEVTTIMGGTDITINPDDNADTIIFSIASAIESIVVNPVGNFFGVGFGARLKNLADNSILFNANNLQSGVDSVVASNLSSGNYELRLEEGTTTSYTVTITPAAAPVAVPEPFSVLSSLAVLGLCSIMKRKLVA